MSHREALSRLNVGGQEAAAVVLGLIAVAIGGLAQSRSRRAA
jgi:hypothetical protein